MKLSVIVPMYNIEKYIEECLESLLHQTYPDFEILVVNDGSQDNGPRIVERMALHHPQIKLLHKENGGLSDARNYAIDYALGEYITFLDSDDFIDLSLYEKMIGKMDEGYDVVVCDIEYFYEGKKESWTLPGMTPWPIQEIQKRMLLSPMFAWNKMYRRSLFKNKNLRYPLNTWYEDIPVTSKIIAQTDKIASVDAKVHYRQREGSIMSNRNSPRIKEIFSIMETLRFQFKEMNQFDYYRDELEYLHIEHLCLYGMFRFMRSDQFDSLYDEAMKIMKQHFPKWKKNPYIQYLGIKNQWFLKTLNRSTRSFWKFIIQDE